MKPKFSLPGVLVSATQVGNVWSTVTLSLNVIDRTGVYLLSDVLVNDKVFIDTSAFESGSYATYKITSISSRSGTLISVTATFEGAGSAPDLSWCLGGTTVLTRGVNGVYTPPAPRAQGIDDVLPFSLLDQSLGKLASIASVTGIVYTNGKITNWTVDGNIFAATYGANGLAAVTKNGQPFFSITYNNGLPTAVLPA